MSKGGARNRSGPQLDPNSGRSDRRGIALDTLPAEGYDGEAPAFPLQEVQEREAELWAWAWTLPQAAAWARESWRWHTVAMWVRTAVLCEGSEAQAADKNSLHRFADQIGMTPAGLRENGWKIAADEVSVKRTEVDDPQDDPRTRLMVVSNGGA